MQYQNEATETAKYITGFTGLFGLLLSVLVLLGLQSFI